jgi:hypothetical protein
MAGIFPYTDIHDNYRMHLQVMEDLKTKAKILILPNISFNEDDLSQIIFHESGRIEALFQRHDAFDDPQEEFIDLTPYLFTSIDAVKLRVKHQLERIDLLRGRSRNLESLTNLQDVEDFNNR